MIIGAELSVRAAVVLAALLKTRPLFLGLTVIALGSSAPQRLSAFRRRSPTAPTLPWAA